MIDVQSYFDRVGYQGSTEPTLETLGALVAAHNKAIPFENLDPLLGVPVFDLSPTALADKLVRRRRGGYCYEQNGVMGSVLEALGYGVERLAARVVWMKTGDDLPARTHQVLSVDIPDVDGKLLVDVGFGGQTLTSPIRLEAGPPRALGTSRTGFASAATGTCSRPRSAANGSPSTRSPRRRNP